MNDKFLELTFLNEPNLSISRCRPFVLLENPFHPSLSVSMQFSKLVRPNSFDPSLNLIDLSLNLTDFSLCRRLSANIILNDSLMDIDILVSSRYECFNFAISSTVP